MPASSSWVFWANLLWLVRTDEEGNYFLLISALCVPVIISNDLFYTERRGHVCLWTFRLWPKWELGTPIGKPTQVACSSQGGKPAPFASSHLIHYPKQPPSLKAGWRKRWWWWGRYSSYIWNWLFLLHCGTIAGMLVLAVALFLFFSSLPFWWWMWAKGTWSA